MTALGSIREGALDTGCSPWELGIDPTLHDGGLWGVSPSFSLPPSLSSSSLTSPFPLRQAGRQAPVLRPLPHSWLLGTYLAALIMAICAPGLSHCQTLRQHRRVEKSLDFEPSLGSGLVQGLPPRTLWEGGVSFLVCQVGLWWEMGPHPMWTSTHLASVFFCL